MVIVGKRVTTKEAKEFKKTQKMYVFVFFVPFVAPIA
jgi:hypothetical protein